MKILLTGGAGFIGSNLTAVLLDDQRVTLVRIVDNLSNGSYDNIREFAENPRFEFINADIRDHAAMVSACAGIDVISHQAALGSVPRSVKDPLTTNEVNITGTINVLDAAVRQKVKRIVLACSSSTYGDSPGLPKVEDRIGMPLSPYAVTKYVMELYASVFQRTYGLEYVGLRYFNVFGPKQSPDNPYAAVIPLFSKAFLEGRQPVINGDGTNSRDFTYVDNAVQANLLALFTTDPRALNQVYNVACGEQTTLTELVDNLRTLTGKDIQPVYGPPRAGDIPHSRADITKIKTHLGFAPTVLFKDGLGRYLDWLERNV